MWIINTTFVIERSLVDFFTDWLDKVYISEAFKSESFASSRVSRVVNNDDPDSVSMACELHCESLSAGMKWHEEHGAALCVELSRLTDNRTLGFTTCLECLQVRTK